MRALLAALAAITACLPLPALAAPLLSRANLPAPLLEDRPSARAAQYVSIDPTPLLAARTPRADEPTTLQLDLLGRPARLNVQRVERRSNGTASLFARVNEHPDASAVITLYNGFVSARIEHPDLGVFVIEPTPERDRFGDPLHLLIEIDADGFKPCAVDPAQVERFALERGHETPRGVSVIDQMVVYTPAVRNALGGHDAAIAFCQNAVDLTNQAYADSLINNVTVNLVHVQEVDYSETGNTGTDLQRLRLTTDGFIDDIPVTVRNAVGADNVAMIINAASNACGQAASINPASANLAFSVSVRSCAISNLTFPHELGHTMGCAHDRAAASSGWFSYSFGHVFTITGGGTRRTIMATSSGSRIARFSNPDVTFAGGATGVPIGQPSAAHNAETHRLTAALMAGHRTALGCQPFAITADPENAEACLGESATLSVETFESTPGLISYQWRRNAMPIPGANAPSLNLNDLSSADSAIYDCVVSNGCIDLTSQVALLSVIDPVVTLHPFSQTVNEGQTVIFEAGFSSEANQIFWEKDGTLLLDGLGSTTLTLNNVTQDDEGDYTCTAIFTCGSITTDPARLTLAGQGCSPVDLAEPFGVLDFTDVLAFLNAFGAMDPVADLAPPLGTFDFSDILAFATDFSAGCP
ncbi:MAG: immunoglobulin domain-containing protein [Phycisphaerales bacterium JB059]